MEQDYIAEFREFMRSHGIETDEEIIGDGEIHRFTLPGDRPRSNAGWYYLFIDENPYAEFGSWKTGVRFEWFGKRTKLLTLAEKKAYEKKITEQRRIREEKRRKEESEAAIEAKNIWDNSPQADGHDYLQRKGVRAFNVRVSEGNLVVPLRGEDGKLYSLQYIWAGGTKRFFPGGRIEGCFAPLTLRDSDKSIICICEGYATAASIFEATGYPTIVAFNTSNLKPVAEVIRKKYPDSKIIICADNDQWTLSPIENPGVFYARKAADAIGALIAIPQFAIGEGKPTDFNDLHQRQGLEAVRSQINAAIDLGPPIEAPGPANETTELVASNYNTPIVDWPMMNGKGKPLATVENLQHLLIERRITVRYNVIKKDLEISIPGEEYLVDTQYNDKLTRLASIACAAQLPRERIDDFVSYIGGQNPHNPVINWICSKAWDGKSRLEEFYETIKSAHEDDLVRAALKKTLIRRWLIQAVAVAFSPVPISTYGVLVFTGKQHIGKTHWFNKLAPAEFTKDGLTLRPDDKDSVLQAVSFWLVELGELDSTFKRSEISQLKAFITNKTDIVRPAFSRKANTYQRRTVFFGSVNDEEFLADQTGNRRFWTIKVEQINYAHQIDMQQLWAEVYELYKSGESYYLTHDELLALNESNKEFEITNPIEELIRAKWGEKLVNPPPSTRELTASEICQELGIHSPRQSDTRAVAKAMRDITGKSHHRHRLKGKVYHVPYNPE